MFPTNPRNSTDIAALVDCLLSVPVGNVVTWDAMSRAIGRSIKPVMYLLHAARKVAARDHGAVFANVRGVGYQRLALADVPGVGKAARHKIRRTARRSIAEITAAITRANDTDAAVTHAASAELSALALLEHLSGDRAQPKAGEPMTKPEPVAVTARRFMARLTGDAA